MKNTENSLLALAFTFDYYVKRKREKKSKEGYVAFSKHYLSDDVEERLQQMHGIIDCQLVDYAEVEIDGIYYDIWFDEKFLLKSGNVPMLYIDEETVIFGNFLVMRSGVVKNILDSVSLEKEDIARILKFYDEQFPKLQDWCMRNHTEVMHISN